MIYLHAHNLCINHRCISKAHMLISNLESIAALGIILTYIWLHKHNIKYKLYTNSIKIEAIKTDKLLMYMTSTLIHCS